MLKSMGFPAELRRIPGWLDGTGPKVNLTLFGLGLGGVVPWLLGYEYLDPMVLIGISLASVVFVAAAVGNAGQETEPRRIPVTVLAITTAGTAYAMAVILLGVSIVNLKNWYGMLLIPPAVNLFTLPLLPAGLSAFLGAEGIRLARGGHKPRDIGARFRWTVLLLVMAWYLRSYWMPAPLHEWVDGNLVSETVALATVVVAAILASLAALRVRGLRLAL
jgi:hypothetical protein